MDDGREGDMSMGIEIEIYAVYDGGLDDKCCVVCETQRNLVVAKDDEIMCTNCLHDQRCEEDGTL